MVYLFTTLSLLLFRAVLGASNAKALDDALASSRSKQPNINLHRAANAKDGRVRYCKQALADGAELDAQHPISKQTALMGAVLAGNDRIVAYLLGRGADAGVPEKDGYTPMHGAGFQGRAAVARALLAHGISPAGTPHRDGFLPIHRACWGAEQRHADTVRALLEAGTDPADAAASDGRSLLEICSQNAAAKKVVLEFLAAAADAAGKKSGGAAGGEL
jgi:ankyrin repeat protein